jgi:hypothetical protein
MYSLFSILLYMMIVKHKQAGGGSGEPKSTVLLLTDATARNGAKKMTIEKLAEKLNPRKHNFSPKMAALLGAILGYDYGVRDSRGGRLTSLNITSDGFVICGSTASDGGGAFVGEAGDLHRNLAELIRAAKLTKAERKFFFDTFHSRCTDYSLPGVN